MIHLLHGQPAASTKWRIAAVGLLALCGCQAKTPPAASTAKPKPVAASTAQSKQAKPSAVGRESMAVEDRPHQRTSPAIDSRPLSQHDRGTLVDLVAAANASRFELPQ